MNRNTKSTKPSGGIDGTKILLSLRDAFNRADSKIPEETRPPAGRRKAMPKREMDPEKKKDLERRRAAEEQRERILERSVKVRQFLPVEKDLARLGFQLAVLIDLLDRRRSIFGRRTLPRKLLNKVLKKKFQEIKAQIEAAKKAETKKEETQPARKES